MYKERGEREQETGRGERAQRDREEKEESVWKGARLLIAVAVI